MAYRQNNSHRSNDEVHYDLMERIGVLNTKDNGWTREVNIVAWNGGAAKVDIREWDPTHERMTKGVTLFEDEAEKLARLLAERYGFGADEDAAPAETSRWDQSDHGNSGEGSSEGSGSTSFVTGEAAAHAPAADTAVMA